MYRLYTRAKYNDQAFLVKKFLIGLLNKALKLQIIMHHRTANDYETLRETVVKCHTSMIKAVQVGKGNPPFSLTGLTQQSDTSSQETHTQWRRWPRMCNSKEGESMDMAQIEGPTDDPIEVLFFMGANDFQLRDRETEADLAYWEGDLPEEHTTITEMVQGKQQGDRACFHCYEVGHLKDQCPQRCQGQGKPMNRPAVRGRGTGRPLGASNEPPRGRSSAPTWQQGTFRGRGRPFNGRTFNTGTVVTQITEISYNEECEREEASQNPE